MNAIDPPSRLLRQGIAFFNDQQYFQAHEVWEDLWRMADGQNRTYYQGLVQIAVGFHHLQAGNHAGGMRVLRRGLRNVETSPSRDSRIDNGLLISDIYEFLGDAGGPHVRIRSRSSGSPSGSHRPGDPV